MDVDGKYQAVLPRKLPWEVRVGSQSFTPQAPGNLKGDIELDFNSVGACVGGQLTFEGYADWRPYSDFIQVFVEGKRIGLGVVGVPQSTRSETGKRTTQVPIVGLHALDADGLAALGLGTAFPEVGVGADVQLLGIGSPLDPVPNEVHEQDALGFQITRTDMVDPPFGELVNAGFQRMFRDNPLASWGVRPDGVRVAGIASGGPNLSSTALNVRAQPANYEPTSYISELAERPAERWHVSYRQRNIGRLMPRRGAAVQSDTLLGDVKEQPDITFTSVNFDGKQATNGYLLGLLDIRSLVANSIANPAAHDVTYQLTGVKVTVEAAFWFSDDSAITMPVDWQGENYYHLDTWQDTMGLPLLKEYADRLKKGVNPQGWAELYDYIDSPQFQSLTVTTVDSELHVGDKFGIYKRITAIKDKDYWKDLAFRGINGGLSGEDATDYSKLVNGFPDYYRAVYPPRFAEEQQKQWDNYLSQLGVNLVWAEWLTSSGVIAAPKSDSNETLPPPAGIRLNGDKGGADAALYFSSPVINATPPVYKAPEQSEPPAANSDGTLGAAVGEVFGTLGAALQELQWKLDPKTYQATNAQLDIDPKKDPGLKHGLYRNSRTLWSYGSNAALTWTFTVPKELIGQLDPSLGNDYKWAFAMAYSGIRLGLKSTAKVTAQAQYSKRILGSINTSKDVPGYEMQTFTTPTLQGRVLGEVHTGPFTVDGQQMANAKVIISKEGYRTEFQTGAPNGGR